MKSGKLVDTLVSVEAAWICAAEVDVQREEEEREEVLAKLRKQSVKDKYELASAATRLDQELREQQLQWRKKTEMRRLRQLPTDERELAAKAAEANSNNNRKKGSIYVMENLRLAMLMKDTKLRQRVKKKKMRPRIVQDMLALERRYTEGARRLQKWWREHLHRQFWLLYFRQVKATVQIQRIARGYLTRRWVRVWHINRTVRVIRLQSLFRSYYIRCNVIPTWRRWEFLNAAKIQSLIRMHLAKTYCLRYKRDLAALRIQSVWRGYISRKQADICWLEAKATSLQRLVRGALTRKKTRRRALRMEKSAIQIQRMYRGMRTRANISRMLRDRETNNRQEFMAVLEVEEEWHRVQRDKLRARLNRKQLQQRVAQLEYEYFAKQEQIHDMESIFLDMQTQRMRVSPRAIEQGWVEEMDAKMKQQRILITKMKLQTVFGIGLDFKQKEKELAEFQQRIYDVEEKRRRFEIWRNEEYLDYWERECRFLHQAKLVQRRQHVAETRRKWQIQFYRTNGKRDNRWRGTYWSQDVLDAAKEKQVFCVGSTDILAAAQDKWRHRIQSNGQVLDDEEKERNTREHISDLTNQIASAAATAHIEQTKMLFDPIFREVERSFNNVQKLQRRHDRCLEETRQQRKLQETAGTACEGQADYSIETSFNRANHPVHEVDRLQRKRQLVLAAKVPWHLLDQLEAERRNLAHEKAMFKLWGKANVGE